MSTIKFPIEIADGKIVTLKKDEDITRQAVLDRLATEQLSIGFRRTYGSNLPALIFEQNEVVLQTLLRNFINEALAEEERITVKNIAMRKSARDTTEIFIRYTIVKTNEQDSIRFLFNTGEVNNETGFSLGFSLGFES